MRRVMDVYSQPVKSHSELLDLTSDDHPQYRWAGHVIISGRYYFGSATRGRQVNQVLVANTIYCQPFQLREETSFDEIACNVQAASGAGTTLDLGVYDSSNFYPDNLLAESGVLACDSTGNKTASVSLTLSPGLYYLVVWSDSTPTLFGLTGASCVEYFGASSPSGLGNNSLTTSETYGSLPSSLSAYSFTPANSNLCVRLRAV